MSATLYGFTSGEYTLPNGDSIEVNIRIDVEVPDGCAYVDDDLKLDTICDESLGEVYLAIEQELGIEDE